MPPSPLARCHDRQTVSTGGTALRRAVRYAASHRGRTLARLIDLLAFPTVSASARHRRDLESCAAWLARLLREIGLLDVRVAAGRVAPVVTGRWYGLPCAPTVLVYGHYDVQPVGPVSAWANDPFRAVRSGRYLYARGASDDKGQLMAQLAAVEAWMATAGRLPLNVHVVLDGEEEVGSPTLLNAVSAYPADLLVVSDTRMRSPTRPVLVTGLRGAVNARLEVSGAPVDLHAGGYGGLVADPAQVLCRLVASLHDGTGRIAVDGLSSVATGHRTQRPAIVVIDLETSGSGRTVVSASAAAALNVRLVGSQDPAAVGRLLKAHLATRVPPTVRARLATTSGCPPYVMDDQAWPIRAVQHVCTRVFGRPAALEPSGGSIPFVNTFAAAYRVPAVLLGFGLPDDGAHAANERLYLPNFVRGMVACTQLYHELARSAPP